MPQTILPIFPKEATPINAVLSFESVREVLVFPWTFPGVFAWGGRLCKLQDVHESTGRDGAVQASGYRPGIRSQHDQRQEACEEVQSRRPRGVFQGTEEETVHGVDPGAIEPCPGIAGCGPVPGSRGGAAARQTGYAVSSDSLGPVGGA